jgi:hypothetical protein
LISTGEKNTRMLTFDLHYHPNIQNLREKSRARRLQQHLMYLKWAGLDCLASTEHSYKAPLDAYLRLSDALSEINTVVLPGVECVSREGVDMVFIYRNEEDLRSAVFQFGPLSWSVKDTARIAENTGAVTILPHPFALARSAACEVLSPKGCKRLLKLVDYVEIHNGSALTLMQRLSTRRARPLFRKTLRKISMTLNLPREWRGNGLGWAVSSDAHYPGEQFIVGVTEEEPGPGEDYFDLLKRRIRFKEILLRYPSDQTMINNMRLLRNLGTSVAEGLNKDIRQIRKNGLRQIG